MQDSDILENQGHKNPNRHFYYQEGKLYFDRKLERYVYFIATMIILLWSALAKLGLVS